MLFSCFISLKKACFWPSPREWWQPQIIFNFWCYKCTIDSSVSLFLSRQRRRASRIPSTFQTLSLRLELGRLSAFFFCPRVGSVSFTKEDSVGTKTFWWHRSSAKWAVFLQLFYCTELYFSFAEDIAFNIFVSHSFAITQTRAPLVQCVF
jgi:hypothetical protein